MNYYRKIKIGFMSKIFNLSLFLIGSLLSTLTLKKGKKLPIKEISPTCRKCQKSHFENTREFDEHVLSCYDEISTKNNTCLEFKVKTV